MSLSQLVAALPVNPSKSNWVHRLMRILVHSAASSPWRKSPKPPGRRRLFAHVRVPSPPQGRATERQAIVTSHALDPMLTSPWQNVVEWFQSDDPTPFLTVHGRRTFGEHVGRDPRRFNEAMASDSRLAASVLVKNCKGVFGAEFAGRRWGRDRHGGEGRSRCFSGVGVRRVGSPRPMWLPI
ncbi:hypothetical protein RHMOL_Rhmol04G0101700 [Rhododendron molle]|uniref:Uncharacterized protein n=1 Tax=Rhododendron molle TaxID=49168 RepID=A0ACC0P037_RHOML|nr:hypothetical protein RHMOL_Rhmol04G0101700 [Rhododendron molle]